jgi:hypothetical protein
MVSTVVSQQDEIISLQSTLTKVTEEATAAQNKIIEWTKRCVEQLQSQNKELAMQLKDAQIQLKNFSYNIQGFVDESVEMKDIVIPDLPPAADVKLTGAVCLSLSLLKYCL